MKGAACGGCHYVNTYYRPRWLHCNSILITRVSPAYSGILNPLFDFLRGRGSYYRTKTKYRNEFGETDLLSIVQSCFSYQAPTEWEPFRLDYLDNADLIITPDCNDIMLSCLSHVRRIGPLIGELTHMDIRGHRAGKYRHLDMGRAKTEHLSQLRFKMSGFVYRAGDKGHVTPQPSLLTVWFMFIQNPTLVAEQ